jgi:hypothetical protein
MTNIDFETVLLVLEWNGSKNTHITFDPPDVKVNAISNFSSCNMVSNISFCLSLSGLSNLSASSSRSDGSQMSSLKRNDGFLAFHFKRFKNSLGIILAQHLLEIGHYRNEMQHRLVQQPCYDRFLALGAGQNVTCQVHGHLSTKWC